MNGDHLPRKHDRSRSPFTICSDGKQLLQLIDEDQRVVRVGLTFKDLHQAKLSFLARCGPFGDHQSVTIPFNKFVCHILGPAMYLTPIVFSGSATNSPGVFRPGFGVLPAFRAKPNQLPLYEHHNRHGGAAVRKKQA
jgi:hypothetical protein